MEKQVNIDQFKQDWSKIESKLDAISNIKKPDGDGEDFEGYSIDAKDGISYNSSTPYSGCDTDHFDFTVSWDELNEPISYFEKKYADQIEANKKREQQAKTDAETLKQKKEIDELNKLKAKYPYA
jgi:hypothetical protein